MWKKIQKKESKPKLNVHQAARLLEHDYNLLIAAMNAYDTHCGMILHQSEGFFVPYVWI